MWNFIVMLAKRIEICYIDYAKQVICPKKECGLFNWIKRYNRFQLCPYFVFGKNVNSIYVDVTTRAAYKLVWRQSEFAFFVRQLRPAHFFICGNKLWRLLWRRKSFSHYRRLSARSAVRSAWQLAAAMNRHSKSSKTVLSIGTLSIWPIVPESIVIELKVIGTGFLRRLKFHPNWTD